MKTYKTIIVPVKCSNSDYSHLWNCNKLSAEVWNICVAIDEHHRAKNNGEWIDRNELQRLTKKCVPLHAKGIHHAAHKYIFARDSALKARKGNGENNQYPHRKKRYFTTGWDVQSVKVKGNAVYLPKPKVNINGKDKLQKPVKCYVKSIPNNIVEVELIYRNGNLKLAIKYKEEIEYQQIESDNAASIDLGEIHAIASIDSSGNGLIVTGRKLRAIKYFRNKEQGKIYRKMSKCTKGSKQYNRYKRALKHLTEKTNNKMLDAIHKISKLYLDYCIENNVSTVYYGDLDSATRNTKKRTGRHTGQKLNQWNYGELIKQLNNKLSRYGIKMIKVSEAYTSQTRPNCKEKNKPTSRNYSCKCGYIQHRDIVGAINILNFNAETNLTHYTNKKYLRIV